MSFFSEQKGGDSLAENLREQNTEKMGPGNQFVKLIPRFAFTAFLAVTLLAVSAAPVYADTIFDTAKNDFSKSGRTVDESRSWLRRIIVCWAALMTLGAIVTYFESIIPKSMFGG